MVQPLIFKFGGASIKDSASFTRIIEILKSRWKNGLVIVVSAAGDTTDHLEEIIQLASDHRPYSEQLNRLEAFHMDLCKPLFAVGHSIFQQISNEFAKLKRSLENEKKQEGYAYFYDQIIGYGELISTRILQELLCQEGHYCVWQDARELIATDSNYKLAKVDWVLTMQRCRKHLADKLETFPVVTQGFIGSDWQGTTTTLGREGSDFTAAILAVSLGAKSVTIWKDVAGILNGDPDLFPDAVKFEYLDFEEAAEMTYFGAKVIHPKTIKPLAKQRIPLYVKSFIQPDSSGTVIGNFEDDPKIPITVIRNNQVLASFRIKDLSKVGGFHFEELFDLAKKLNWNIHLTQGSAVTVKMVIDKPDQGSDSLPKSILENFIVEWEEELTLVTIKNYLPSQEDTYESAAKKVFLTQKSPHTLQLVLSGKAVE
jgi:aspartate kinase